MKYLILFCTVVFPVVCLSQFDLKAFDKKSGVSVQTDKNELQVDWPAGDREKGRLIINLGKDSALVKSISLQGAVIMKDLDPVFVLTVGKGDLVSQNG